MGSDPVYCFTVSTTERYIMNLRDPLKFRHIEGFRAIMFTGTVTGALLS